MARRPIPSSSVSARRTFSPETARALVDDGGALCTLPHRDGLDGFYAVRVRRR